jgi:L-amino acid N-acyltransferase YncA
MMEASFREAVPADWGAIWPIFREVVREGSTYAFPSDISEDDARKSWMPDEATGRRTFVARHGGVIVGTAFLKPNHAGPGDHVANAGWMVAPDAAGQGIGRAFALHVLSEARDAGFRAMQFNAVVSTNRRAIALWKSLGFSIIGTVPAGFRHPERGRVDLHIMHREL